MNGCPEDILVIKVCYLGIARLGLLVIKNCLLLILIVIIYCLHSGSARRVSSERDLCYTRANCCIIFLMPSCCLHNVRLCNHKCIGKLLVLEVFLSRHNTLILSIYEGKAVQGPESYCIIRILSINCKV